MFTTPIGFFSPYVFVLTDDLDGSQTINSSEELKQLCTNLVVKLDLPMDVQQIDKIVHDAGAFEDDDVPAGEPKPAKGSRHEWTLEEFVMWFVKKVIALRKMDT